MTTQRAPRAGQGTKQRSGAQRPGGGAARRNRPARVRRLPNGVTKAGNPITGLVVGVGPIDGAIVDFIEAYRPRRPATLEVWPSIRPIVVRVTLAICPPTHLSAQRSMGVVSRFSAWGATEFITLAEESLFTPSQVETFIRIMEDASPTSRATYRSRLETIGRAVTTKAPWPPLEEAISRAVRQPPYMQFDLAAIEADLANQPTELKWRAGWTVHAFGLGVGPFPAEFLAITADDITVTDGVVEVALGEGPTRRVVPVLAPYGALILELAERFSEGPIIYPLRRKWDLNTLIRKVRLSNLTPPLSGHRYRSTWLTRHLELGTPLKLLLPAAGLVEAKALHDLLPFVPDLDPAVARRLLAGGER